MTSPENVPDTGDDEAARPELDEQPPLLGAWRNIYLVVLGNLAVLVLIFWTLTRVFNTGEGP